MMAQPAPLPEMLMAGDPRYLLDTTLEKKAGGLDRLDPGALADYRACFDDPAVRHAMCEDYRAGATTDETDDLADRAAGRMIEVPVLLIWEAGRRYGGGREPLDIWRDWASNVEGVGLNGGHLLPETASEQVRERIEEFFGRIGHGG
ncbi:alpha/beta fold hydrolase [Allorhizobium pseudoryzae]|uniref:alpha/beta fold hydrolase n=1 Tax=Allorhizobium pseudoryzae TaxID=379684 RepID=UPI003D069CD6